MFDYKNEEKKWNEYWEKNQTFKTDVYDFSKPKFYCLDMFPYPSGEGLHMGHLFGYTASDALSRFKRLQGYNVLHPMGYDAFGLPAEQYAIKTGNHPNGFTQKNIANFRSQMKKIGLSIDWSKERIEKATGFPYKSKSCMARIFESASRVLSKSD